MLVNRQTQTHTLSHTHTQTDTHTGSSQYSASLSGRSNKQWPSPADTQHKTTESRVKHNCNAISYLTWNRPFHPVFMRAMKVVSQWSFYGHFSILWRPFSLSAAHEIWTKVVPCSDTEKHPAWNGFSVVGLLLGAGRIIPVAVNTWLLQKKLNSLKHTVRTTVAELHN